MKDHIIINGFSTATLPGCVVTSIGAVQPATARRVEFVQVHGANGTHSILDSAFDGYDRTLEFFVKNIEDVQVLLQKFNTLNNKLEFGYQPDSFFFADFKGAEFEPIGKSGWKVSIDLLMQPFRYTKADTTTVLTGSGSIKNPGTVYSEPIITIEGTGDVTLTIGQNLMELTVNGKATIDCRHKMQNIYNANCEIQNTLRKRGSFFELPVGVSGVHVDGTVTKITIQGNWRYLV